MAEPGDVTRRGFLVRVGATVLGTYLLPALDTELPPQRRQGGKSKSCPFVNS